MRLWTALFAFVHHLAAFAVMGALVTEHVLFAPAVTVSDARKLQRIDLAYGAAALLLVAVGLARVFYFEKGASYYFHDGWFIVKLTLFAVVGLVSIYPTMVFLSDNSSTMGRNPGATMCRLDRWLVGPVERGGRGSLGHFINGDWSFLWNWSFWPQSFSQ